MRIREERRYALRTVRTMILVAPLLVVAAGCHKVTGGGTIVSATGVGKASFGFSANCLVDDTIALPLPVYEGQFQ
jgi:hypothetical protein